MRRLFLLNSQWQLTRFPPPFNLFTPNFYLLCDGKGASQPRGNVCLNKNGLLCLFQCVVCLPGAAWRARKALPGVLQHADADLNGGGLFAPFRLCFTKQIEKRTTPAALLLGLDAEFSCASSDIYLTSYRFVTSRKEAWIVYPHL